MELPQAVIEKIASFIPRDKELKSATSDCIRHLVLYEIHLINFKRFPRMTIIQHAFMAIQERNIFKYLDWVYKRFNSNYGKYNHNLGFICPQTMSTSSLLLLDF